MKKLYSLILLAFISVGFVACGGGGGSSSFSNQQVDITIACLTTPPASPTTVQISTYHELFTGDKIVQDQAGTVLQYYTPVGQNTRVCLESGAAHIVRN